MDIIAVSKIQHDGVVYEAGAVLKDITEEYGLALIEAGAAEAFNEGDVPATEKTDVPVAGEANAADEPEGDGTNPDGSPEGEAVPPPADEKPLNRMNRDELDAKATEVGIENPAQYGDKKALRTAIEAALEAKVVE